MVEQPGSALARMRTTLILIIQALEEGLHHASDYFEAHGYLRSDHAHLYAMTAKAYAIEGPLREAELAGVLRMSRGPMESLRVTTAEGDDIWVQRPEDGAVIPDSEVGTVRPARSGPQREFRKANPEQLRLALELGDFGPGRLSHFIMLWHLDPDLGLMCRLVAPYAAGSSDWYWSEDFDLVKLLSLEPDLDAAAAEDLSVEQDGDEGARGDEGGDLDLGAGE